MPGIDVVLSLFQCAIGRHSAGAILRRLRGSNL
jgi:hypothetical protein